MADQRMGIPSPRKSETEENIQTHLEISNNRYRFTCIFIIVKIF